MMILKTFFLNNLIIFVFLLINISNLSICFRSFASFLQPCLTGTKDTKNADWNIMLM